MLTAERLFAEYGVFAISNRQISEAAGQGNNTAVSYHFGSKTGLVRAIVRRHTDEIERLRIRQIDALTDPGLRDWVACLVRPNAEHMAASGNTTWFCRFSAQVMTDPALNGIVVEESLGAPSLRQVLDGLSACLPQLPAEVRRERGAMARHLLVHVFAEHEGAVSEGSEPIRGSWQRTATGLIDAITGMLLAPATRV